MHWSRSPHDASLSSVVHEVPASHQLDVAEQAVAAERRRQVHRGCLGLWRGKPTDERFVRHRSLETHNHSLTSFPPLTPLRIPFVHHRHSTAMDPLSPSNINAGWASSPPQTPSSALASSSSYNSTPTSNAPASASASASASFREAKVYGAPTPTLVNPPGDYRESPANGQGSTVDGQHGQPQGRYMRVRIGGLERNRKDMLVRFDASVSSVRRCTVRCMWSVERLRG